MVREKRVQTSRLFKRSAGFPPRNTSEAGRVVNNGVKIKMFDIILFCICGTRKSEAVSFWCEVIGLGI